MNANVVFSEFKALHILLFMEEDCEGIEYFAGLLIPFLVLMISLQS